MTVEKSKRIFYLDALRAAAILSVIVVHVYAITRMHVRLEYSIIPSAGWLFCQMCGNCFRFGVDLFLMLAGALSLGRVWTIREFLGKRIPRICGPFVFWGLVTGIIGIIISYYFGFTFIRYFDYMSILLFMKGVFLATSPGYAPYWFFWMILGTYLIMPVFNKWLLHSDLTEAEYFLFFWLITVLFDFTINVKFPIKLSYFTSPIGLVVLGYYLRHTERKILNNPYFSLALILIAAILTMVNVTMYSTITEFHTVNRYSMFLTVEVAGIYLFFKNFHKLNINLNFSKTFDKIFRRFVFDIAKYSYGIYLIHGFFLCIYLKLVPYNGFFTNFIELFILIFVSSMITMYVLEKVPYVNKVIGAK